MVYYKNQCTNFLFCSWLIGQNAERPISSGRIEVKKPIYLLFDYPCMFIYACVLNWI